MWGKQGRPARVPQQARKQHELLSTPTMLLVDAGLAGPQGGGLSAYREGAQQHFG